MRADYAIAGHIVDGWVKVRLEYGGRIYEGLISPEDQCDNPYTTCN